MENGLTSIMAIIDDHPVTALVKTLLGGDGLGNEEQVPDELTVRNSDRVNVCDMFFRHNERMNRRLRVEVLKGNRELILVHDLCGDLFLDDFAEQTVWDGGHFFSPCALPAKLLKKQDRSPV